MANTDPTNTCSHDACSCRVADDETHPKDEHGAIYCSEGCLDGEGCSHEGCDCAED